ncbi:MAG: M20/M25/M40 family metallo-hydrolase, partial [Chitinophagaceae bacterium]
MLKLILILFFLFLFNSGLTAQSGDSLRIKSIVDEVMVNGTAYDNLRDLCKKAGPRLSGSAGYAKAVKLTKSMMQLMKFDTVYVQSCKVPNWVRGEKEKGWVMKNGKKIFDLDLCALGLSLGSGPAGVTADVVLVNNFDELDKLGVNGLKGKIVFYNFVMDPRHIGTFQAYGESGGARRSGPWRASKYGAKAVLIRSLASNVDQYPHTGATQKNDTFPRIPSAAISTANAEKLATLLIKGEKLTVFFRTNCKTLPDAEDFNVIGELRGSRYPAEIITVGGHLDSWDLAEGAHDDGAGCVQSMEVLRTLRSLGIKPKRTIRAVLFANEESGGKGSDKYVEVAKAKNEQHIFAIESDAGGFTPRGFSLDMTDEKYDKILQWKPLFLPYGVYDISKGGSGPDVGKMKVIGTALAGFVPDGQRYFDIHHAGTDVFESVSKRELLLGAANMAA